MLEQPGMSLAKVRTENSIQVSETQSPEPSLLAPGVCFSKKVDSGAGARCQTEALQLYQRGEMSSIYFLTHTKF